MKFLKANLAMGPENVPPEGVFDVVNPGPVGSTSEMGAGDYILNIPLLEDAV